MREKYAEFIGMEPAREINTHDDGAFLYRLKQALLLAVKEEGILDDAQYAVACKELERRDFIRSKSERGEAL